jgi:hypothetical protein
MNKVAAFPHVCLKLIFFFLAAVCSTIRFFIWKSRNRPNWGLNGKWNRQKLLVGTWKTFVFENKRKNCFLWPITFSYCSTCHSFYESTFPYCSTCLLFYDHLHFLTVLLVIYFMTSYISLLFYLSFILWPATTFLYCSTCLLFNDQLYFLSVLLYILVIY